jgi:hypothetical protein
MKIEIDEKVFNEKFIEKLASDLVYMYLNGRDLKNMNYDEQEKAAQKRLNKIFDSVTQEKISDSFIKALCAKAFSGLMKDESK